MLSSARRKEFANLFTECVSSYLKTDAGRAHTAMYPAARAAARGNLDDVMTMRGRGKDVKIYQFMKVPSARFGEHRSFEKLGVPVEGLGDGFSWKSQDLERSAQLAREGWEKAKASILSGEHFLVVCDEITYPLVYGWVDLQDVLETLRNRPKEVHVCLTGRRCPQEIVDLADTVTEMRPIKHAFDAGIPAQRGIED